MNFNKLIPELTVFDLQATKEFYDKLGFVVEYERPEENFTFMSLEGTQFMFEQLHEHGWNIGELTYPLGQGINFSVAVDDVNALYQRAKSAGLTLYKDIQTTGYEVNGVNEEQTEFLIQDPSGYLLRFTN